MTSIHQKQVEQKPPEIAGFAAEASQKVILGGKNANMLNGLWNASNGLWIASDAI